MLLVNKVEGIFWQDVRSNAYSNGKVKHNWKRFLLRELSEDQLVMYKAKLADALESIYVASAILADAGVAEGTAQTNLKKARTTIWELQDAARLALEGKKKQSG